MRFSAPKPAPYRRFHQTVTIVILAVFLGFPAYAAPLSIGPRRFDVEEARTPKEHEQGLMFRRHLATDRGMLFIFAEPVAVSMWMKDTLIPLDMLFIDSSGIITYIAEDTVPESLDAITAGVPVKAVLELPGGTCKKQGITAGDKVTHALFAAPHS